MTIDLDLCRRFEAAFGVDGDALPTALLPTPHSVAKIEAHFGLKLPPLLLYLAQTSPAFYRVFHSLGPISRGTFNLIQINSYWRRRRKTRRLPRDLVILTQGFMDERFWCLKLDADRDRPEVRFWTPDRLYYHGDGEPGRMHYPDFETFLYEHIKWCGR